MTDGERDERDQGGETACWAGLVCDECGAVDGHHPHCGASAGSAREPG